MNPIYREYLDWNYTGRIMHLYGSIEDQVRGTATCQFCKGGTPSRIYGPCNPARDLQELKKVDGVDMLMTGSPCNPYSIQRQKRFASDSVQFHHQFAVTDTYTIKLVTAYEPKKWVFEQVMGFTMPFSTGTKETPKQRFLWPSNVVVVCHVVFY